MATAKKLPSGNWRVRLYIGENSNGKKLYKSFTARTKKEAEFLAAEYNLKRKGKPKDLTIGDAIDGYIANKTGYYLRQQLQDIEISEKINCKN